MIRYECDRCGAKMGANDAQRFIVKIEVYAAAGHVDLARDEETDSRRELDRVMEALAEADPDDMEDQTYRCFRFDLCDDCRRKVLSKPLG
ncbi:MAG: hypothetical protein AABZ12_10165 [Planctomycetota bacterium]